MLCAELLEGCILCLLAAAWAIQGALSLCQAIGLEREPDAQSLRRLKGSMEDDGAVVLILIIWIYRGLVLVVALFNIGKTLPALLSQACSSLSGLMGGCLDIRSTVR